MCIGIVAVEMQQWRRNNDNGNCLIIIILLLLPFLLCYYYYYYHKSYGLFMLFLSAQEWEEKKIHKLRSKRNASGRTIDRRG